MEKQYFIFLFSFYAGAFFNIVINYIRDKPLYGIEYLIGNTIGALLAEAFYYYF